MIDILTQQFDSDTPKEWIDVIASLAQEQVPGSFPCVPAVNDLYYELSLSESEHEIVKKRAIQSRAWDFKDTLALLGMYGYISKEGAKYLVDKFPGKTWLDPFAGRGWFAKALREAGATVYAADIEPQSAAVTEVLQCDAETFVKEHGHKADIMLFSWAERDRADYRAAKAWGAGKLILNYGELGECCNSSKFTYNYHIHEHLSDFPDLSAKSLRHLTMVAGKFAG